MPDSLMQNAANLHQAGRLGEAAHLYQQVLRGSPRNFEALYSLGVIHLQTGEFDDAQRMLGDVVRLNPRLPEAWCYRGIALLQLRQRDEAIFCFDRALALTPNFVEALSSRATALLEMNRLDEALNAFDRVLAIDPNHAISWNNRGNTFVAMRRLEDAVASFDRALALKPDLEIAQNNRMLALLELKRVDRIPAHAVRTLFDDYASYYDAAMLQALSYRAPEHLRALLKRVRPDAAAPLNILDLGCGTGLSGDAFKDLALGGQLDGVDLSTKMIDEARRRDIYTRLITADFDTAFDEADISYDLVIGADSLIYCGDLVPALSGAARRLVPGGVILFTVEKKTGDGLEQTQANRFRHSESYVRSAAEAAGLTVLELEECALRSESREPVIGYAVGLEKPKR